MKIVFNIEKKHLIFLSLFLVLMGSVFVIAVDNPKVFHEVLYTDIIKSHSGDTIKVEDNSLKVSRGIIFGTGDDENLYKIYATVNKLNYGGDRMKNIFRGEICGDNANCISINDIIEGLGEEVQKTPEGPKRTPDFTSPTMNLYCPNIAGGRGEDREVPIYRFYGSQFCEDNGDFNSLEYKTEIRDNLGFIAKYSVYNRWECKYVVKPMVINQLWCN